MSLKPLLNWNSFLIAGLRGTTLLSKLVFTIILARQMSAEHFGQWILISALITYGIFVIGAELYNISLRNYVSNSQISAVPQMSAQWSYFLVIYIILASLSVIAFYLGSDKLFRLSIFIALILILEHCTHELHRLAFFQDHQIHANVILFLKSAAWMVPTGVYLIIYPAAANLAVALGSWLAGTAVAAVYALFTYRTVFQEFRPHYLGNFKGKLGRGLRILMPFLVIAMALRTPLVLDRYLIDRYFGPAQLGAYGYYATFGNGIQAIFDAVILARLTPQLLKTKRNHSQQITIVGLYIRQSVLFWLGSIFVLYFSIPYLTQFVGKEIFRDSFNLLLIMLVGQMIFSLSSVLHYGLYSLHRDRQLANGAVCYMALAVVLYIALIPQFGSYGAAVALAISAAGLLALRIRQLLRGDSV